MDEIKAWWKQALLDLKAAKNSYKSKDYHIAAFLSQQAAEKGLKSLQIKLTSKFDKTHDLVKLGKSVNTTQEIINLCSELTIYYTVTRYPDVGKSLNKKKAFSLIEKSEKVIEWLKQMLNL